MTEYKLGPRFFSFLRRRMWLTLGPVYLIAVAIPVFIIGREQEAPLALYAVTLLVFIGIAGFAVRLSERQQARSWSTLRLRLDDEGITQVQDTREVRIKYSEITRIARQSNQALVIQTADRFRFIAVLPTLENFDEFRRELAQHHAIEEVPRAEATRNRVIAVGAAIVMLAVFVLFFTATNRYVVIAASVGLLLITAFLIVIRRKLPLPGQSAWAFWFTVIVLVYLAVTRIAYAVQGP